jgi:hypothetical protein
LSNPLDARIPNEELEIDAEESPARRAPLDKEDFPSEEGRVEEDVAADFSPTVLGEGEVILTFETFDEADRLRDAIIVDSGRNT